jgi:hypothetical protein
MNLPIGHEPLVLKDGTVIDPETGLVLNESPLVPVPNMMDMKREIVAARKRLTDLPLPPSQMNTISVILSYTLFGLNDNDISLALLIPEETIANIKKTDAYNSLQTTFVKNIVESDLSNVRSLFVQKSRSAAQVMFDVLDNADVGIATKMAAAKDVLDRAGQRPVDVVEHRHKMEGGLTIEYVEKKDDLPIIENIGVF